jgi:hypothetical protein
MESSGAGAHVALATPTPVPQSQAQSLNELGTKMDFDSLAWMGLPDDAGGAAPDLHSPFNDTFVPNPFQSSNVRQSIDEIAVTGAQNVDQSVEVTAPTDFSLPIQPDAVIADDTPLLFDPGMDTMDTTNLDTNTFETNNLETAPVPQDVEQFQFGDSWDQVPPVEEASQAVSEPEKPDIAEMNGFAQLSFQDGEFLVTSTQVILGRDDKFAKKYQQEQKLAKRRMKEGSRQARELEAQEALHEYQQEPSHPSAHDEELSPGGSLLEGRPARGLASAYSEQGGIVGLPEDEKRRRRNKKRRRNLLLSGQSSSTTSVAPANLHAFKYDIEAGDDDDVEDAQKPVFLPVHPNNPADIKLISREHLQIEYSSENSRWELKILGRSAYVKNEHYYAETEGAESWEQCEPKLLERDEVAILTHLTEIIVASLRMQFRLPRNTKVVSTFDSDDSELSDVLSSPTQPPLNVEADERSDSDSSDEDDVPLQSVKQKKLKQQQSEQKAKTGGKSAGKSAGKTGGKAGKKPVMLHLKKRKNSEASPVKPPPATPKQPEKGKKPKKTVVAGSEPEPEPEPVVEEKKKDPPPPPPMQLHLPPAPTQAQIDEQASDMAVAQALTQSQYSQPYGSAPPEASASATSTNMMYAPQNPTEPVAFEPGSMLSEVPQDQLPEKRKGPGRPPKNGLISKRDMGIIRRKQKEFEKQGIPVPPLDELVRIVRTENKAKEAAAKAAARGEAPPPMAQNFPIMQSIEMSSQEPCATPTYVPAVPQPMQTSMGEGDYASVDPEAKGSPKRQRTYRSPSPMKSKEECTEEELKKPNHTYYTTLDEILSEGPPEGLELQQIYDKICKKYPYYKYGVDGHGWQSSVRHNLKQHDRFQQVTKQGKGWLWAINQEIPFDKEKKRKPTPPPVQRPQMPYPMANGMAQPGMQPYGNPYAYGQPQYQQPPAQPGQQYGPPYGQPGQPQYAQPGAPQYVPAGSQQPANQQYPYAPQQPQQPQYQPNGLPPPPVPARTTPTTQRQGSGTPHPQPGFNNLVDEIMAYRSDYLRPYAHLQSTPLYKEQEDVFKKCVEWISELQCNGTPQLNFANDQERRVFTDLERIMRKYQNPAPAPAPTSAPAPATNNATNTQPAGANATAGAQAPAPAQTTTANGEATTATAPVDANAANAAGTKRSAPDDISGEGSDAKRMKVEGEETQTGVSTSTAPAFTATADASVPHQVPQTAEMGTNAPASDPMVTESTVPVTDPVFDFSNPSDQHPQDPVFDFSTPDNTGEQVAQPVFEFGEPTIPAPEAKVEQQPQPQSYAPVPTALTTQPPQQNLSQPVHTCSVPGQQQQQPPQPQPAPQPQQPQQSQQPQQPYSQPGSATSTTHQPWTQPQPTGAVPPPQVPQQRQAYSQSQAQPPSVAPNTAQTTQPPQAYTQTQMQAPAPAPQQTQAYSQPPAQGHSAAPTPQPAQTYSQPPPPQPQNTAPTPQPLQAYAQPPAQAQRTAPTPQPAQTQTYSQPPSHPPSAAPTPQPPQAYSQPPTQGQSTAPARTPQPGQTQTYSQPPSQPPSTAPTPQPPQAYSQPPRPTPQPPQAYSRPPSQPIHTAPTPQQSQSQAYSQPPSRSVSTAPAQQPAPAYSQPPSRPTSAAPAHQPTQAYSQPPSQSPRPAMAPQVPQAQSQPQPVQHQQPPSRPASAVQTPQPVQHHQPPSQPPSHPSTPQQVQQPGSNQPTPSHTPVPASSMAPAPVEHAVQSTPPVAASGDNPPSGSATGGNNTPAPQT